MAPIIATAKITLSCPLFACDFVDSSKLVVGGGGGAGRNGVPNKIVLLDTSNHNELAEAGEIELSKYEDSVTSLAVGQGKGNSIPIYAGINPSQEDVVGGKNTHFRVLTIQPNPKGREKSVNKITQGSRTALFSGNDKDIYQRKTRLSRPYKGQPQVGAVLSGFAKVPEIRVLDFSSNPPKKIPGPQSDKESVDCDFISIEDDKFLFASCDDHDVWVSKVSRQKVEDPTCFYTTPASGQPGKPSVPSFKGLRWLTKDYMAMLSNIPGGNGVVVQILRSPPKGKGFAAVVQSIRLPSSVSKATEFAVANLTPPLTPSDPQGYSQFIIAVAGHDISIHLYKIDLQVVAGVSLVTKIKPFKTLKKDHPIQITSLAFSNFTPPTPPVTAQTPQQHLKLASTSMSNTVVVHTIPLFPVPLSVKRGQSKSPRYVVALPSSNFAFGFAMVLSVFAIAIASIFIESLVEIRGGLPSRFGATKYIPIKWQNALGKPYEFPAGYSSSLNNPATTIPISPEFESLLAKVVPPKAKNPGDAPEKLADLVKKVQDAASDGIVIINDYPGDEGGVMAHLHDEEAHGAAAAKKWEDLPHKQKEGWKKKLSEAGHWAEDMGETIFKGVLFGELAGVVREAVAGG